MFEIGKTYQISTIETDSDGYGRVTGNQTVTAVDGNLVKFEDGTIINTMSPLFDSAVDLKTHETFKKQFSENMDKWLNDPEDANL
ncbi:hypothetical protein MHM88_22920 [Epibacterium sp. MM17-32]|uniref:hypothetical protein n=1 Tax=Epibacterium sp. MM17-32 TaxID=2917734 RepID=UPI001EF537CB|nr:hypothetical protein [Epibacterium sp. MM17-32]MCG7630663.1 hypothetical protein [Epibacterium sp. MM17-32]